MDDAPSTALDPDRVDFLKRAALAAVTDHMTAEVVTALRSGGIRSILLRGPATAAWLYDIPGERLYGDADLLVDPRWFDDARETLQRLGFTSRSFKATPHEPWYNEAWVRQQTMVELHHTVSGAGAPPQAVWEVLSESVERMNVADTEVEVPDAAAKAVVLALHTTFHGIHDEPTKHDLSRALDRVPLEVWQRAAVLADRLDATAAFGTGLRLVAGGSALAAQLQVDRERSVEAEIRAESAPNMAYMLAWLTRGDATPLQKLIVVARKLFPPAEFLRAGSPLAARGPLGLAAARVVRPFALLANLPTAALAYWRARRAVSRASD